MQFLAYFAAFNKYFGIAKFHLVANWNQPKQTKF